MNAPARKLPLEGLRVVEFTHMVMGPTCGMVLADMGAEVIKVEPIEGDRTRHLLGSGAGFFPMFNRNKKSIQINLQSPEGAETARRLCATADVVAENFKPGSMAKYGLDYASLSAKHPQLIYASLKGFGQTGPYSERAGYDYAVQGIGGLMSVTGERDDLGGGPQKVGVAVADLFTGMYATVAVLAALRHAEHTGKGQHVDMALLDTQVAMLANLGSNYLVSGKVPGRAGNAHQNIVPYQVFEVKAPDEMAPGTRDHLILAVGNDGQFAKFCAVAGHPELAKDPRYALNADRVRHRAELVPQLEAIMKTRTKATWLCALEAAKVPCGAINTLSEVFADPQVKERGMVSTWSHPIQPDLKLVSSPIKMSLTPVRKDLPPPMLGQHTAEVLTEVLGWTAEQQGLLQRKGVI